MTQEERIDRYVEAVLAISPPLTETQKDRLRDLFAQGEPERVETRGRRAA